MNKPVGCVTSHRSVTKMNLKLINLVAAIAFFSASVVISIEAQQPAPNRNSGSISGRITVDGKPKAGVVVELLATDANGARRPFAKTTTSKTGKYVLRDVASGTYDVSPSAPTLSGPNQGKSGQSGKSVAIEAGESVKGIDFDLVSNGSISGRVRDVSGEPVKGQTVQLLLRGEGNYSRPFNSSAPDDHRTNDEGVYRISGVPPGRYILKVGIAYGLATYGRGEKGNLYYPETFHPSADEESKATVVEVASGRETTDVDITVAKPLRIFEIAGQLINVETGGPVPNVGLEIISTSADGRQSTHLSGGSRSNANGEFRIQNALPGRYVIAPEGDRTSNTYGNPISVDVKDEDVTGVKIPMHSASTLTGIVTIEGSVYPFTPDVLSRLTVYAHTMTDNMTSSTVTSPINADGSFRITGIRPGKVTLASFMRREGSETFRMLRLERNGVELRDGIDVHPAEEINGLRLVLGAGTGVLRGDVKIEGGPLEGINLYVLYRSTSSESSMFYRAELDARRHFVITGLTPGDYELLIGPMSVEISGAGGSRMMNRMPTVKQTVTVGAGVDAEVTLVLTLKP